MLKFLGRTVVRKLIALLIISIISFLILHLAPGDPAQVDPLNPRFTPEQVKMARKAFHLDKPLHIQYYLFYRDLFSGRLTSWKDSSPVLEKILRRFLNSLPLFIVGTIITWCFAFPVGIQAAIRRGTAYDRATTFLSYLFISLPSFFLALLLITATVNLLHIPVIGMRTFGREGLGFWLTANDRIWHLVLPSFLGALGGVAVLSRYVRGQMLEVIGQDYVRTAMAKGLTDDDVYYKHALRNALLPFITMFGMLLPGLVGGSVIIESIFAWPGMGRLFYDALLARDIPIILAGNFISAVLVLAGTFLSDLLYMVADPRIKV